MSDHSILQRLLNAQNALRATIYKILDLNRQLKRLTQITQSKKAPENQAIKQELKLLNKVADQQAKIVQLYEYKLQRVSSQ